MKTTSYSILTIDDDANLRRGIVSYLEDRGYTVYQACGGAEGIEMFAQYRPDLVFTDLMMPDMSGLAVVTEIKKLSPDTPVVVISGNGSVQFAITTVRNGAADYITKPILDFSIIDQVAEQVLEKAKAQKAEREELEKSKKHLNDIEQLAGGLAHDFKNLLTGITGNLYIAQMHLDKSHKSAIPLKRAEQASQRADKLAKRIMNITKPEEETMKKQVQVREAVKECLELSLSGPAISHAVMVPDCIVNAAMEEGEFCQVINNLILNAAQAMQAGGHIAVIGGEIILDDGNKFSLAAGRYVYLRVVDTGCGMKPEVLARIFEPHFTTKPTGNGLGLSSVRRIVENSGGRVSFESAEGSGTIATLVLPACAEV